MPDAAERLRAALGDAPPPGVAVLDDAAQVALAELVEQAKSRQTATLERSFAASLKHVPFPARGIVKKMLLG